MTDPRGTTQACPACDDTDIRQRLVDKHDSWSDPDAAPWVCEVCGNEFDDPVTRTRQSLGGRRGLAGQLARADPDDGDLVTDGGTVEACPECDTAAIERRTPAKAGSPAWQTHRWYCRNCGASFDEPVERAPITSTTTLSGLAADLDAADPDVIPDGGARLRSKADANTGELSRTGVVGWPKPEKEYVDLVTLLKEDIQTDGGRPRRDQIVAAVLEGRGRPSDRLRDGLRADGRGLPDPDRSEQARRARQAATSLIAWSRQADIDPAAVLDEVRDGLPRADGGDAR